MHIINTVYNKNVILFKFWTENLNAQDHVRKVCVNHMIILKWIVKKIKCDEVDLIQLVQEQSYIH